MFSPFNQCIALFIRICQLSNCGPAQLEHDTGNLCTSNVTPKLDTLAGSNQTAIILGESHHLTQGIPAYILPNCAVRAHLGRV